MYNYSKYQGIITVSIVVLIVILVLFVSCINNNYKTYIVLNSVASYDNIVEVVVDNDDYERLKSSNYIYINDMKTMFNIESIVRNVLRKNNKKYHLLLLDVKLSDDIKVKDSIPIVVYKDKENILSLLISCFKED